MNLDSVMNRSRLRVLAGALIGALVVYFGWDVTYSRRLIDGSTGKPLPGAYAIFTFQGETWAGVESRLRCYRVEASKTDENGEFRFPAWRKSLNPFMVGSQVNILFYKAGFQTSEEIPFPGQPFSMVADTRPDQDEPRSSGVAAIGPKPPPPIEPVVPGRESDLDYIIHRATHCSGRNDKQLRDVFVAMLEEARSKGNPNWWLVSNLLYEIDKIDVGGEVGRWGAQIGGPATDRYLKRREQLGWHAKDVGKGPLWSLPVEGKQ